MVGFGWIFAMIVFMDFFVNDMCQILVLHTTVTDAVRPQLRSIYRVLSEIYYRKVVRGRNPHKNVRVIQHLSPSCRSARLSSLSHLSAAGILSMLDDFDVYRCLELKDTAKIGFFSTLVLWLPSKISGRFPMVQQTTLDMMIPIAAFGFVLLHIFLQTVHVVLMMLLYFLIFCYIVRKAYKVMRKEKRLSSVERNQSADDEDVTVMHVGNHSSSSHSSGSASSGDMSTMESLSRRVKSSLGMHVGPPSAEVDMDWKSINSPFVSYSVADEKVENTDSLFSNVVDASELEWDDGLADVYAFICDIYNERFLQNSSSVLEDTVVDDASDFPSDRTDIVERTYAYSIKIPDEIASLEVTMDTWKYPAQMYWLQWWATQMRRLRSFFPGSSPESTDNVLGDGPSTTFALNKFHTRNTKEQDWDQSLNKEDENSDHFKQKEQVVGVGQGLDDILEEDDEDNDESVNDQDGHSSRSSKMRHPYYPSLVTLDTFGSNRDEDSVIDVLNMTKSSNSKSSRSSEDSEIRSPNNTNKTYDKSANSNTSRLSGGGNTRSNPVEINYENVSKTFDTYASKCKSDAFSDDGKPGALQVPIHNLLNLASAVFSLPEHVLIDDTLVTEDEVDDTLTSLRDYVNYAQQQKRTDTAMMKFDPFIKWLENACGAILLKRRTLMSKKLGKKHSSRRLLLEKEKAEQENASGKGEEVLQMELAFNDDDGSVVSEMTRDSFLQDLDNTSMRSSGGGANVHPRAAGAYSKYIKDVKKTGAGAGSGSGSFEALAMSSKLFQYSEASEDWTASRKSGRSSGRSSGRQSAASSSSSSSSSSQSSGFPNNRQSPIKMMVMGGALPTAGAGTGANTALSQQRSDDGESEGLEKDLAVGEITLKRPDSFNTTGSADGLTFNGQYSVSGASDVHSKDSYGSNLQGGVVVSELSNVLDYRPSQAAINEEDEDEEENQEAFRYSDMSYAGAMSTNTRHSIGEVMNTVSNHRSDSTQASDTDDSDSCFRYSDMSFTGAQSVNTRNSTKNVVQGTFQLDDEEFNVDVSGQDETEDSHDESFDVDVAGPGQDTGRTSGGFSDLTYRNSSSDRGGSFDLQEDVQLGRASSGTLGDSSDDMSLGTAGGFTINTRNSEGTGADDESNVENSNGVKIKETLFFM